MSRLLAIICLLQLKKPPRPATVSHFLGTRHCRPGWLCLVPIVIHTTTPSRDGSREACIILSPASRHHPSSVPEQEKDTRANEAAIPWPDHPPGNRQGPFGTIPRRARNCGF